MMKLLDKTCSKYYDENHYVRFDRIKQKIVFKIYIVSLVKRYLMFSLVIGTVNIQKMAIYLRYIGYILEFEIHTIVIYSENGTKYNEC